MCLIIYKKDVSGIVTEDNMAASINHGNNDGAGIMFVDDGRVKIRKMPGIVGKKSNHSAIIEFCNVLHKQNKRYVMHHRLGTKGMNTFDNTHPFEVLSIDKGHSIDLQMMHNGIIHTGECNSNKDVFSDTWHFVNDYLKPILEQNPELIHTKAFQTFIKEFVGTSNKLVFLDNQDRVVIINETMGTWRDGVWLSNTSSFHTYSPPALPYSYPSNRSGGVYNHTTSKWESDDDQNYVDSKKKSTTVPPPNQTTTTTLSKQSVPIVSSILPKNKTTNYTKPTKTDGTCRTINDSHLEELLGDENFFSTANPFELMSTEEIIEKLLENNSFDKCQDFVLHSDSFIIADVLDTLVNEYYNNQLEQQAYTRNSHTTK